MAGPFRQAVLEGVLDPERTIQIGIRGGAEYLWEFSYESGMTVLHAEEVVETRHPGGDRARRARVAGDGPVYSPSTSTASTRASRPAPARPRSAAHAPRGAADPARPRRASTSSAATSSRSRRNTTPPPTPPRSPRR